MTALSHRIILPHNGLYFFKRKKGRFVIKEKKLIPSRKSTIVNPHNFPTPRKKNLTLKLWKTFVLIAHFSYFNKLTNKLITNEDTMFISHSDCDDQVRW